MQEPGPGILRTTSKLKWKDDFVCYFEVEKGGMVDLDSLYMFMYHWFGKEQYTHWQTFDNKIEDFYLHRIRPDGVQENLIWWRAGRRINKYIYYFCKMDWQNFGSKETEIEYNGKKVKTHKLGIVLRAWWWVQYDPYNEWEKSFLGKITKWFYTYLLDDEMENHKDKCREIARRQENELKQFFEMNTSVPMPRSFFPEEGYKWDRPKPRPEDFEHLRRAPDPRI
jgi:hypothetical protein